MAATATKCPLIPALGKAVVRPDEPEKQSKGGILLPDVAQERRRTMKGKIVALGAEKRTKDDLYTVELHVGQVAYWSAYAGTEIELGDEKYVVLSHDDIVATLEG